MRESESFSAEDLKSWCSEVHQSDYSFVKEFFAGIDDSEKGFAMPFNEEALPIFLRLFLKYSSSPNTPELIEAIQKRYEKVYLENKQEPGIIQKPENLEEAIVFAATELDMTLQELVALPEQDDWLYESHQGKRAFTSAEFVMAAY